MARCTAAPASMAVFVGGLTEDRALQRSGHYRDQDTTKTRLIRVLGHYID